MFTDLLADMLEINEHDIEDWLDKLTWVGAIVGVISIALNLVVIWLVLPFLLVQHLKLFKMVCAMWTIPGL